MMKNTKPRPTTPTNNEEKQPNTKNTRTLTQHETNTKQTNDSTKQTKPNTNNTMTVPTKPKQQSSVVRGIGNSKPQIAAEEPIHLTTKRCLLGVFLVLSLCLGFLFFVHSLVCLGVCLMFGECPFVFCLFCVCFMFGESPWFVLVIAAFVGNILGCFVGNILLLAPKIKQTPTTTTTTHTRTFTKHETQIQNSQ